MSEVSWCWSRASRGPKSTALPFTFGRSGADPFGATFIVWTPSCDSIAVELSVERTPREAEQPRRLDALAARGLQGPEYLLALRRLERQLRQPLPVGGALDVRLEEVRGEVLGQEDAALADNHRALEDVSQLAHVPRPRVAREDLQDVRREAAHRAPELLVEGGDEVAGERLDVVRPAAQRRQVDGAHVQAVIQVVAERALPYHVGEVAVGRGDDPDVDADRVGGADTLDLAVLEHAQQLHLHPERQLADLVEEDGAAVCRLEEPLAVAVGAGEGPTQVPEELALEERGRERGAVAHDERAVAERREAMQRAGHQLLARAALAGHERRRGVAGQTLDEGEDLEHALRAGDDALERDTALQALLQDAGAVLEVALLEDALEHTLEAPEVDRLLDVVRGPELDRLDGVRHRRVGAHEHELDVGIALLQVAEQLEPAHLRHADVGEDHVDRLLVEHLQRGRRAVGHLHVEALLGEEDLEDLPDVGIVLDDQDLRSIGALPPAVGRGTDMRVVHGLVV